MTIEYIGVLDGLHTWEVRDAAGALVGINQSAIGPCPGEGWTLDTLTGVWQQDGA